MRLVAPKEVVCDAVHANAGVEVWYRRELVAQIHKASAEILHGLQADWRTGKRTFGYAADAPSLTVLVRKRLDAWAKKWEGKMTSMSERIAEDFASKNKRATEAGVQHSFAKAGFTVKFKPTRPMLDAYSAVVSENVNLIRRIPAQLLADVETAVWRSVTTNSDMNELVKSIQAVYGISTRHAALIARDQNNKAKATFENTRRMELGIEEAYWQHSSGGKVPRPSHVWAGQHKVRYKLRDGWLDPAVNKNIWPGTEVNCRCTSHAIIPGIDDI